VTDGTPTLDRAAIERILTRLAERLDRRGVTADLYIFGGAAIALAFDARRATRDIDALFVPHGVVLEEARVVAEEFGLPPWWLNEQASAYVAPGVDIHAPRIFDRPGLRVTTASPERLLAMKALAARPRDEDDIRLLASHLGIVTSAEVMALLAEVFPDEQLPDRARLLLEDLFGEGPTGSPRQG
jgi:predicted nucleotidyltransferase